MKHLYKASAAVLTLAMCASLLAACGSASSSSAASGSGASSGSTSGTSSTSEATAPAYDYSAGLEENGYFSGVKALDYVKLPDDLGAISLSKDDVAVSDDDVQEQVDSIMASYGKPEQLKEGTIKEGDTVNISYVGSVDGVEFEGGATGEGGADVEAGSDNYIDDFLTQIIGHKPGETFNVEVTFPDDYGKEELNGKDAVFVTTINYIHGEDIVPELNDTFVTETLTDYGWESVADMREQIAANLKKNLLRSAVWTYVKENSVVSEVPQSIVDYQTNGMIGYYESMAAQYGMELEAFIKSMLQLDSVDALKEQSAENLQNAANESLLMQAVAEKAGISMTEDDLAAYFKKEMESDDYSYYIETFGSPYVHMVVMSDSVMNYLTDNAKEA